MDVKKAQGWIKSWIGLKDVCNVGCVDTSRESYARLGGGGDIKGWKDFKEKESRRTPPLAVWRKDLREKLDFQRKSNQDVEGKTSQSKPMPRRRREMDAPEKAKVTCGSPLRFGRRTWSNNADRGDGERSPAGRRSDRSKSAGRMTQNTQNHTLGGSRSKSTSRLKVKEKDFDRSEKGRSSSRSSILVKESRISASDEKERRTTRSMSAARVLPSENNDVGGQNQERGRGNMKREGITEEKDGRRESMRRWGSSWQQLKRGPAGTEQLHGDEMTFRRMRSFSSGRIASTGGGGEGLGSISSRRVGIAARRVRQCKGILFIFSLFDLQVRSTSAVRSLESRRSLPGGSLARWNDGEQLRIPREINPALLRFRERVGEGSSSASHSRWESK